MLDQLAPVLSGLLVGKVPPSVPVVGDLLESFVIPDKCGLQLSEVHESVFLESFVIPDKSGLKLSEVHESVFLESFVNPDISGWKLSEANMPGFDVVEFNGSVAVESLDSVVKSSGSVAAASVFPVVHELVRVISMALYIVAGVCKSWLSLRWCLVLLPGVSSGTGSPQSVCDCDTSFQPFPGFTSDFGFLLVACHVAMTVLCWVFCRCPSAPQRCRLLQVLLPDRSVQSMEDRKERGAQR